jgi:LCP family protein required for cell wall assembly
MGTDGEQPPQYTRYRARRRLLGGGYRDAPAAARDGLRSGRVAEQPRPASSAPGTADRPSPDAGEIRAGGGRAGGRARIPGGRPRIPGGGWRRWATRKRIVLGVLGLLVGWVLLSVLLFLVSSHFERTPIDTNVAGALDPAGNPVTSANNILVLGSDRRQKNSREPGAEKSGFGRSDTILLIRTGGGHSARLSIPRDTIVEIPGHGRQKINAAYAYGGPTESVSVIKHWLGVPINHVVEINFENFPQLIDAMGGVDYKGGCIISKINGGFANGGYTLRLPAGTHHIDGKQALAIARTRKNLCAPNANDIQREEHQQTLFNAMKSRLLSPSSFIRLPWIAWNAPPAIVSDMSGPTLLSLFTGMAISGTPATRVLKPTGAETLPDGEAGLTVSEAERRHDVEAFMKG